MIDYSKKFLSAINNEDTLAELYSDWLDSLISSQLWNKRNLNGKRIPWIKAEEAFAARKDIFNFPGLYIFGTKENIPIYLGLSKGKIKPRPLKKRLRSRYFGPKKDSSKNKKYSQFQIAKINEQILKEKGYEALTIDIFEWYEQNYRNSKVRLIHAEKLAKLGIDGIWFAGLPFREENINLDDIRKLEKKIIPIANNWNINHNYFELFNKQNKY